MILLALYGLWARCSPPLLPSICTPPFFFFTRKFYFQFSSRIFAAAFLCFWFFSFPLTSPPPLYFIVAMAASQWVPGIKRMPTEIVVYHPGTQPTFHTPKRRKHKINRQNKTKRTKKFWSFFSNLSGTHNRLYVTDLTVGKARALRKASQPASSGAGGRYCCLFLQLEGHHCPDSLLSPSIFPSFYAPWNTKPRFTL